MMFSRARRRFSSAAALVALTVAALVGTGLAAGPDATRADAQGGNMVILGDSIIADPPTMEYFAARFGVHPNGKTDVNRWCPTSPDSFAQRASRQLGLQPRDYSCAGTVSISRGPNIASQVDRAVNERGLDGATRRVVVMVGFNDTYNHNGEDPNQIRRDYVNFMRPQIDRIRAAAPNARIQIVGYPTITSGDRVCLFHIGPNMYDATPFPLVRDWENLAQWMNVDLAAATGTQFVDFKPSTAGNGMCAKDDQRMFAGLVDFYGGPGNMPIHINARGHEHLAGVLARS